MTDAQRNYYRELQDRYIAELVKLGHDDDTVITRDGLTVADLRTTLYPRHEQNILAALAGEQLFA